MRNTPAGRHAQPGRHSAPAKAPEVISSQEVTEYPFPGEEPEQETGHRVEVAPPSMTWKEAIEKKREQRMQARRARKERRQAGKSHGSWKGRVGTALIVLIIVAILALGLLIAALIFGGKVTDSGVNYPNVTVDEIPVGGLSQAETVTLLQEQGWEEAVSGTLTVTLTEKVQCTLDYLSAGACHSVQDMAEQAYRFGRSGNSVENLVAYLKNLTQPVDVAETDLVLNAEVIESAVDRALEDFNTATEGGGYTIDEANSLLVYIKGAGQVRLDRDEVLQSVNQALLAHESELRIQPITADVKEPDFDALHDELYVEAKEAYWDEDGKIVEEIIGFDFDVTKAVELWDAADILQTVNIPVTVTVPDVTKASLEAMLYKDKLGECDTSFAGSSANRINNIKLAAEKLNEFILYPGEQFSYNGTVGERTEEAGFLGAPAYADGEVRTEIGGGICQVSSTLYCAILGAHIQIDERQCHYFPVTYLPYGLDATVSWGWPDLKFTNNTEYPLKFITSVDEKEKTLHIEVWGTNVDGYTYEPDSKVWAWYDETYTEVRIGYKARTFLNVYDPDGNLVDEITIDYSEYNFHPEDIDWPPEYYYSQEDNASEESGGAEDSGDSGQSTDPPADPYAEEG